MQRAVKQRKSGCATAPFLRLSRAAARRRNAKEVFVGNRNNLAMLAVLYGSAFCGRLQREHHQCGAHQHHGRVCRGCQHGPVARNGLHDRHGHRGNGIGLSHQAAAPSHAVPDRRRLSDPRACRRHARPHLAALSGRAPSAGRGHRHLHPRDDEHGARCGPAHPHGHLPLHRRLHDHLRAGLRAGGERAYGHHPRLAQHLPAAGGPHRGAGASGRRAHPQHC